MKRSRVFPIVVVAVFFSLMGCAMSQIFMTDSLYITESIVCPARTAMEVERAHYSYHEPGEFTIIARCVGDGIADDVTFVAELTLWGLLFLPTLLLVALIAMGMSRLSKARAGRPTGGAITFNGQVYASLDEMPDPVRRAYEQLMNVFADADQNGTPDILEGGMQVIDLRSQSATESSVQKLAELKEMLDAGLITAEEYEAKKDEILSRM